MQWSGRGQGGRKEEKSTWGEAPSALRFLPSARLSGCLAADLLPLSPVPPACLPSSWAVSVSCSLFLHPAASPPRGPPSSSSAPSARLPPLSCSVRVEVSRALFSAAGGRIMEQQSFLLSSARQRLAPRCPAARQPGSQGATFNATVKERGVGCAGGSRARLALTPALPSFAHRSPGWALERAGPEAAPQPPSRN